MRATLRTATVLVLAVPLVASAVPASAADTSHIHERGSFAAVWVEGPGTPGGLPGNYSLGELSFRGGFVEGFVETFTCAEGESPSGEEDACEGAGAYYAWSDDVTVTKAKGKSRSTTYAGTLDLYDAESEEEEEELAADDVPFSITFTPNGRPSRSTSTESFRDPESGEFYRFRQRQVVSEATVDGSLDGIEAVEGVVGKYAMQEMTRVG